MYPEQNQYPVDYLNQIAPAPQKSGPSKKVFMILLGLGVATFIVVSLTIFSSLSAGPTNNMQRLAARLTTLKTITTAAQPTIKSSQLRTANSSLTITLSNVNRDIVAPLESTGVDAAKLNKDIVASESGEALIAALEDARLNAVYDRTYAREISYQLAATSSLIYEIYNSSSNKALKDFLYETDESLVSLKKHFDDFNAIDT